MTRPSLHATMLSVAAVLASRATCTKLAVGCVLVDIHGCILSTGYNGTPRDMEHCTEHPCKGATMPAGSDTCEAVHAEQNALLGADPFQVRTCYVTHAPCLRCTKLLLNTDCQTIYTFDSEFQGADLWARARRKFVMWPRSYFVQGPRG